VAKPFAAASAPLEALLVAALLLAPAAARAGDPIRDEKPRKTMTREILFSMDPARPREASFRDRFHVSKKRGLEYRQEFRLSERKLALKLYGPLVRKKPGLGLQLEGLSLGGRDVEVRAYGNAKRQGVKVELKF
jgi:hypothetical protein